MNYFAGTIFAVLIVFGWMMFIWYVVIFMLGRDVRRDIKSMGGDVPQRTAWPMVEAGVINIVALLVTAGYFFEPVYEWYVGHQIALILLTLLFVMVGCVKNDRLHHVLMGDIAVYDELKKNLTGQVENNNENK